MIKNVTFTQVTRINLILVFNLISLLALIINNTPSPTEYIISVYKYYPIYFWILYVLTIYLIVLGLLVFVYKNRSNTSNKYTFLYLFSILLLNFIFLSLPVFQRFQYGRGDPLTHLGIIKDLLTVGFVNIDNWYPLLHIFTAQLYYITNVNYILLSNIIPPLFNIGSIIFIYILSRACSEDKNSIFSLIFLTVPLYLFFNLDFAPSNEVFLIFPLFIFSLLKTYFSKKSGKSHFSFNFVVLILLFYAILSHPEVPIFSVLIYLSVMLLKKDSSILNLLFLTCVTFFYWSFDFSAFKISLNRLYTLIFVDWTSPALNQIALSSQRANLSPLDFTREILFTYGYFICIALIVIVLFCYLLVNNNKIIKRNESILFFYLFLSFSLISLAFLLSDFIIPYSRIFKFWVLFGILFIGVTLHDLYRNPKIKFPKFLFSIIIILLFLSIIFNTFEVYNSPITRTFNDQVTSDEIIGMAWFFDHRNDEFMIDEIWIRQDRFFDLIRGRNTPRKNIRSLGMGSFPPDHFDYNYQSHDQKNRYLIFNKLSKNYYPLVYPEYKNLWRFDFEDFHNIKTKNEVLKIYSNSDFEINYIYLQKQENL